MADSSKISVGIVGLSPNRGFASIAHIPALHALSDFEIAAVCTTRQESADAAARHFGIPLAFSNPEDLARHPGVDLVTVTVKVPDHYRPVMAAIDAGKHVYCEWPLGRNTAEAQQMLDAAERKGVRHAVGLQGQWSPTINYVKDLVADGYGGKVLTATLIGCAPNWAATLDRAYQADFANGANLMTITGGHQIDALCYCLGEFREVSAFAMSQRDRIVTDDQGEVALTSPDQLAVSGILQDGAVVSFQIRGGMTRGTEFLFEIHVPRAIWCWPRRRADRCSGRSYRCMVRRAKARSWRNCRSRRNTATCRKTPRQTRPTTSRSSTRGWRTASARARRRARASTPPSNATV